MGDSKRRWREENGSLRHWCGWSGQHQRRRDVRNRTETDLEQGKAAGESGALEEFRGLKKKVKRQEWITSTPVWVEQLSQKEEGRRKSDGNGFGARQSGGGGGRDASSNHGVDPQLWIIENLGNMTLAACSENLRIPLGADGRDICLRFRSKWY